MKTILFLLISVLLLSCSESSQNPVQVKSSATTQAKEKAKDRSLYIPEVKYGPEGFYTGEFTRLRFNENKESFNNKITICIDSLNDENIYGHSVVAGNERPFSGSYKKLDGNYEVTVNEPGDNKYDGRFVFTINPGSKKINGDWVANDPALNVTERTYELELRPVKYNADLQLPESLEGMPIYGTSRGEDENEMITEDAIRINASKDLLKTKDVENLYKGDLEIIRNTIYARHGYSFKNLRMRTLFDAYVDWYMPVSTNVTAMLTPFELKNIELIKRYEAHATRYYDEFGR
jgi:hypothetical protein